MKAHANHAVITMLSRSMTATTTSNVDTLSSGSSPSRRRCEKNAETPFTTKEAPMRVIAEDSLRKNRSMCTPHSTMNQDVTADRISG